jgi:hypothetical protein
MIFLSSFRQDSQKEKITEEKKAEEGPKQVSVIFDFIIEIDR